MKRIFTRIALLAIFAGAFMTSCTEDENNEIYNESKKVYYKNPYDYVGVLHNQELDSIACYLGKNLRFNLKDLYEYNVKKSNINEDSISYATYRNEIKQKQNKLLLKNRMDYFNKVADFYRINHYELNQGFFVFLKVVDANKTYDYLARKNIFVVPFENGIRIAISSINKKEILLILKEINNINSVI